MKARTIARGSRDASSRLTVREALDTYEAYLRTCGDDTSNITRLRRLLSFALIDRVVALLTPRELRRWRDRLADPLAPASVNKTMTTFKAALNFATERDEHVANRRAWQNGLASIRDVKKRQNVLLPDLVVRQIVTAAYEQNEEFGLFVETGAATGARPSQLARLEVQDLQASRSDPRLMMPVSRKGRGQKDATHRPVPISAVLAKRLAASVSGRPSMAPLLVKPNGEPWRKSDHSRLFARAAKAAGQDSAQVTIDALRHCSIIRQLVAGVPVRIVAFNHDTSVAIIERTCSRYIGDQSHLIVPSGVADDPVNLR